MHQNDLKQRLQELRVKGFVPSKRHGSTGIGYTLEHYLHISANNSPFADIDGRIELKATRTASNNLITLFTSDKNVWRYPQSQVITQWGYIDSKGRPALKSTVSAVSANQHQLQAVTSPYDKLIKIIHIPTHTTIASWNIFHIVGKFALKFNQLLLVHAETKKINAINTKEEFYYNSAILLKSPDIQKFRDGLRNGTIQIDIRMHLQAPAQSVRNRGTAFRIREHDLPKLFTCQLRLL